MSLPGVLFLASRTARSQAYAQALAAAGLAPERVLFFGEERAPGPVPSDARADAGVFLPDLCVPLEETVRRAGWKTGAVAAGSVNDAEVVEAIRAAAPRLVIYSGYGGQIVGEAALASAPFLHAHAGWLPQERGSTTLYYGALAERRCGVSAILLERDIDTGPVLARRRYPLPPRGVEVDYVYDNAIRADLLVSVLRHVAERGALPAPEPQDAGEGVTYYVIHPVLKHLSLLAMGKGS